MTIGDPLLAALADAARRRQRADHEMRLLLAYAREHTQPRPYRLADLAEAAGMSVSGARTAYTKADTEEADRRLPRPSPARGDHLVARWSADRTCRERHPAA